MYTPPVLKEGDKIMLVAPAGKIIKESLEKAHEIFTLWGLKVVVGENAGEEFFRFAGTDEQRLSDMQKAIDDPSVKAVICIRGGYGAVRLIQRLDFARFKVTPKWIVGFSDVTVFHAYLNHVLNCESLHAIMPASFGRPDTSTAMETLRKALFGKKLDYGIPPHELNRLGYAKSELTGGNLSILYSLLGTPFDPETRNKILFIEETGEYLYHFDRMMQSMKMAGKLEGLEGLIVGKINKMRDTRADFGQEAYEIIHDVVRDYDYPVLFGFPAGHTGDNRALIMGRQVSLQADNNNVTVRFLQNE
jgi:muramoyltetrapeptide carboxypeptidase